MSYVKFVSLEPHPVGPLLSTGPGDVPAVRTKITPFQAPIPIGPSTLQGMGAGPDGLGGDDSGKSNTVPLLVGAALLGLAMFLTYRR
jgi:hypothetical protein